MDHFLYRDGILHAEDVPLSEIARTVGTPAYVYSAATLLRHFRLFDEALAWGPHLVCYAVKAASNVAILKLLGDAGAGMDVVSEGEYRQINLESEPEMRLLSRVASELGVEVPVTVRVNPDVDARTHEKIATGKSDNKFGIPISRARAVYAEIATLPGLRVIGIDVHIGSQLTDLEPFRLAYRKVADLTEILRADGHAIERLDLGGGLGIPYARSNLAPPVPLEYGRVIREEVGHLGCEIEIEPGRLIAGNAGILLTETIFVKHGEGRDFLIVDAAMNDLIRPAMYGAHHDIVPVIEPAPGADQQAFDIVGPICETGDTFAKARHMPPVAPGDLIAFRSAGAYGAVMASEYNSRPLVPEVLVQGDQYAVIRPRPTFDEMISRDMVPHWLE